LTAAFLAATIVPLPGALSLLAALLLWLALALALYGLSVKLGLLRTTRKAGT
jgi:hypothetical protein